MKSFPIALGNGFFSAFAVPALKGGYGFAMGAPVVLRTKVAPIAKPVSRFLMKSFPRLLWGTAFLVRLQCSALKGGYGFAMGRSRGASHQIAPFAKPARQV